MRRLSLCALFIVAMAGAGLSQGPPRGAAGVRGQVADAEDGLPLRRSRVTASAGQSSTSTVFTDDRGRFEFPMAPSPPFTLRVTKAGYAATLHRVDDADSASAVQVSLVKSAAIAGQIMTVHGAPAARVYVTARLLLPAGATVPHTSRFFTTTDNWGEYRLSGLPPGRYEITAAHAPEGRLHCSSRFPVRGSRFWFPVLGSQFSVPSSGFPVLSSQFRVPSSGFRVPGGSGFGFIVRRSPVTV